MADENEPAGVAVLDNTGDQAPATNTNTAQDPSAGQMPGLKVLKLGDNEVEDFRRSDLPGKAYVKLFSINRSVWPKAKVELDGLFLNSFTRVDLLVRGSKYRPVDLRLAAGERDPITFYLPDFNSILNSGSKIEVELSSLKFPELNCRVERKLNYLTEEPKEETGSEQTANQTGAKNSPAQNGNTQTQTAGQINLDFVNKAVEELPVAVAGAVSGGLTGQADQKFDPVKLGSDLGANFNRDLQSVGDASAEENILVGEEPEEVGATAVSAAVSSGGTVSQGSTGFSKTVSNSTTAQSASTQTVSQAGTASVSSSANISAGGTVSALGRTTGSTQIQNGLSSSFSANASVGSQSTGNIAGGQDKISGTAQVKSAFRTGGAAGGSGNLSQTGTEAAGKAQVLSQQGGAAKQTSQTKAAGSQQGAVGASFGAKNYSGVLPGTPNAAAAGPANFAGQAQARDSFATLGQAGGNAGDLNLAGSDKPKKQPGAAELKKPAEPKTPNGPTEPKDPTAPNLKDRSQSQKKPEVPPEFQAMLKNLDKAKKPFDAARPEPEAKQSGLGQAKSAQQPKRVALSSILGGQGSGSAARRGTNAAVNDNQGSKEAFFAQKSVSPQQIPPAETEGENVPKQENVQPNEQEAVEPGQKPESEKREETTPTASEDREDLEEDSEANETAPPQVLAKQVKAVKSSVQNLAQKEADMAAGKLMQAGFRQVAFVWFPSIFTASLPTIILPIFVVILAAVAGDVFWLFFHRKNPIRYPLVVWQKAYIIFLHILILVVFLLILAFLAEVAAYLCQNWTTVGVIYMSGYEDVCKQVSEISL